VATDFAAPRAEMAQPRVGFTSIFNNFSPLAPRPSSVSVTHKVLKSRPVGAQLFFFLINDNKNVRFSACVHHDPPEKKKLLLFIISETKINAVWLTRIND
jgi:hypothetical protein